MQARGYARCAVGSLFGILTCTTIVIATNLLNGIKLDPSVPVYKPEDFIVVINTEQARLQLALASRPLRVGLRTFIALDNASLAEELKQSGHLHNETYAYFPNRNITGPEKSKPGDTRWQAAPFMAHRHYGPTYKWMLLGDDDTLWFMLGVKRLLYGYDHNLPYAISDHMGDHNARGFFLPSPLAAVCSPCHWTDLLHAHHREDLLPYSSAVLTQQEISEWDPRELDGWGWGDPAVARCPCRPPEGCLHRARVCRGRSRGQELCGRTLAFKTGFRGNRSWCGYSWGHGGAGVVLSVGLLRATAGGPGEVCARTTQVHSCDMNLAMCLMNPALGLSGLQGGATGLQGGAGAGAVHDSGSDNGSGNRGSSSSSGSSSASDNGDSGSVSLLPGGGGNGATSTVGRVEEVEKEEEGWGGSGLGIDRSEAGAGPRVSGGLEGFMFTHPGNAVLRGANWADPRFIVFDNPVYQKVLRDPVGFLEGRVVCGRGDREAAMVAAAALAERPVPGEEGGEAAAQGVRQGASVEGEDPGGKKGGAEEVPVPGGEEDGLGSSRQLLLSGVGAGDGGGRGDAVGNGNTGPSGLQSTWGRGEEGEGGEVAGAGVVLPRWQTVVLAAAAGGRMRANLGGREQLQPQQQQGLGQLAGTLLEADAAKGPLSSSNSSSNSSGNSSSSGVGNPEIEVTPGEVAQKYGRVLLRGREQQRKQLGLDAYGTAK
ncbi:hypothetical protein VOLCADRAFT_116399, partial [Volvox carteri f. nagariensis]